MRTVQVAATVVVVSALAAAPGSAGAGVRHVHAGQSIQAAIDGARPGDTVAVGRGVFHENLTVTKDHITLRGSGDRRGGTVLEPPRSPHPSVCNEAGQVNGICVTGEFVPNTPIVGRPVTGARVRGFLVRGFSRYGILLNNAIDTRIVRDQAAGNGGFGIVGFFQTGVRYVADIAHDNRGPGLHIGDSPHADAVVVGNRVYRNSTQEGVGLFIRDASFGVVRHNRVDGNCAGMLFVDSNQPGPVTGWMVHGNVVRRNNAACPPVPEDSIPALSGFGITLLGTDRVTVRANRVAGNRPTGDTIVAGGVVVGSSRALGGADPTGNRVTGNRLRANAPADLVFDGRGNDNTFVRNRCGSSTPTGLCT
jgi:nitrous oxidase accessory protein NosD